MKSYEFETDMKTEQWEKFQYSIRAETIEEAQRILKEWVENEDVSEPEEVEFIDNLKTYDTLETVEVEELDKGFNLVEEK